MKNDQYLPTDVFKAEVQNLIGMDIYVIRVNGVGLHEGRPTSRYFYEQHGQPDLNDEHPDAKYYDYKIYYPSLNNSFLMHGTAVIEYITLDSHPEFFL